MKNLPKILMIAACVWSVIGFAAACSEEEDCSMTARPMMQCNLYNYEAATVNKIKEPYTLDEISVTAFRTDSVLINKMTETDDFSLPLNYTEDTTKLVLHYTNEITDTILMKHVNTPYFVSMDCGYQMKQTITDVTYTKHMLDSIYLYNNELGIYATENLQLYY